MKGRSFDRGLRGWGPDLRREARWVVRAALTEQPPPEDGRQIYLGWLTALEAERSVKLIGWGAA